MKHFIILLACLQYSMTLHEKEWPTRHESLNHGCPDGWLDGGHLGCFLFLHQETSLSWMEAQEVCEHHGGFLAEVKDEEQHNFIESFAIIEESITGVTSWWLGLTDSGHEGRWVWSHSDTEVSFTSWSPGHPNISPDNQDDCVSISLEDHFHWKDAPCFSQSHTSPSPICQQPASTDPTTTTITTPTPTTSTTTTTSTGSTGFLLLGGMDDHWHTMDNVEAYGYDLSLPSLPSLPLPTQNHIAEMTESGAIYLAGGYPSYGSINNKTWMLPSLSSSKWEEVERMPTPVYEAASVVVKDNVLVLGGFSDSDTSDGHVTVWDVIQMLETNKALPTWKILSLSKLPDPLGSHSAAVFEGQVIIVTQFGVTYTTSVSSIISDTKLHWVRGKLPGVEARVFGPSVEVVEDKLVAVFGNKVFTKTTMDSQWVQLGHLPQEKTNKPSIGSVQGNIVIGGGYDGDSRSATVFMWVEASSEWEEVNSLKIPRQNHATVQLHRGIL